MTIPWSELLVAIPQFLIASLVIAIGLRIIIASVLGGVADYKDRNINRIERFIESKAKEMHETDEYGYPISRLSGDKEYDESRDESEKLDS